MSDTLFEAFPPLHMPELQTFTRLRAGSVENAYNPDSPGSDWAHPETLEFYAAIASSSSNTNTDRLDRQLTSTATLTIPDPHIDIRVGDRIRPNPADGREWRVSGIPATDMNPFTGWNPTMECQLEEVKG